MAPINKGFLFAQLTANEIIFSDSINYLKNMVQTLSFFGRRLLEMFILVKTFGT